MTHGRIRNLVRVAQRNLVALDVALCCPMMARRRHLHHDKAPSSLGIVADLLDRYAEGQAGCEPTVDFAFLGWGTLASYRRSSTKVAIPEVARVRTPTDRGGDRLQRRAGRHYRPQARCGHAIADAIVNGAGEWAYEGTGRTANRDACLTANATAYLEFARRAALEGR
jgi:hypothetical protein